jgi:hypothetical protein
MNERITKIVINTLGKEGVVNSRAFGHWALSDEEMEKFAELIVRECAEFVKQWERYQVDMANQCNGNFPTGGDSKLKEHFGVKE